jgi:hypothetical protein
VTQRKEIRKACALLADRIMLMGNILGLASLYKEKLQHTKKKHACITGENRRNITAASTSSNKAFEFVSSFHYVAY